MWFRAVAAALAVWCACGAATAAGYTEVWNPPEASGHAVAKAKKQPEAGKVKAGAVDAKHGARGAHPVKRLEAGKTAARGGVKKVAAKGAKGGVKQAGLGVRKGQGNGNGRSKAAVVAQSNKSHTSLVHAKAGQGKTVRADLAHPARPHAVSVAAKSVATKPTASRHAMPVASANFNGGTADASTNPATASSGSLPPIIH